MHIAHRPITLDCHDDDWSMASKTSRFQPESDIGKGRMKNVDKNIDKNKQRFGCFHATYSTLISICMAL
jgi:hypothetical protein